MSLWHAQGYVYLYIDREREQTQVQQLKSGKEEGDSVSHHRSEVRNWIAY